MNSFSQAPVSLGTGKAVRATDKAIMVETKEYAELWIPKSQIHDDSEVWEGGHEGVIRVKAWWATKEGIL